MKTSKVLLDDAILEVFALLQCIFPVQELKLGLLHCRWILYQLNYEGSMSALQLRKLRPVLRDDLEGRAAGGGKESSRGRGYMYTMADSFCCMVETNNILKQLSSN